MWDSTGMSNSVTIVNGELGMAIHDMESDGEGGVILVWDLWNDPDEKLFAQHITSEGLIADGWAPNGIVIADNLGDKFYWPVVTTDGEGGVIIAWQNRMDPLNTDIYAQRITYNGIIKWTPQGIPICTAIDVQEFPKIVSDDEGGAIIAWNDGRSVSLYNKDPYALRINQDGNVVSGWTANGTRIAHNLGAEVQIKIASDRNHGIIAAWTIVRSVPYGSDIKAQRIDYEGNLLWDPAGIDISNDTYSPQLYSICTNSSGYAVIPLR